MSDGPSRERKLLVQNHPESEALMFHWAERSRNEVGGVFEVVRRGHVLYCKNPVVLPQTVPTRQLQFSFDPEALMRWQEEHLETAFKEPGMPYLDWGIWHSHADSGVGWSNLDQELIDDHGTRGLLVNIVVNKRRAVYCRVDTYAGGQNLRTAFRVEVPCEYGKASALSAERVEWANKLFDECVVYADDRPRIIHEPPRQAGFNPYTDDADWSGYAARSAEYRCGLCHETYAECTAANHHRKKKHKHAFKGYFGRGRAAAALSKASCVAHATEDGKGTVTFFANGTFKVEHESWRKKGLVGVYQLTSQLWDEVRELLPTAVVTRYETAAGVANA